MPRTIAAAALALFCASALSADTLLTKRRDANEFISLQGQISPGAKHQKVEIWIGSDRVRRDDGRIALILRLDQHKLYLVNHAQRVYTVSDAQLDGSQKAPQPGMTPFQFHAKAEPTGEKRTIGSWQAVRYQVALISETGHGERIRLTWWVAPDLAIEDAPLRALQRLLASASPEGEEWMATLLSLPGQPVLFERAEKLPEVEVKSREELVSVKRGEAPPGIYEPPAGYRLMDFFEYRESFGVPGAL
jgi:hypothetical protein